MIEPRLLAAAGIEPDRPAAELAAELVRRMPLRWRSAGGTRDIATVLESRWFAGVGECHRVLGQLFRGTTGRGLAFGVTWPYLEAGGRVAAPGLPTVVGSAEEQGPDGAYQITDRTVWREARGQRSRWLELKGGGAGGASRPFDLLWFGGHERYCVADGVLEIEDLFSALRVTVTRARLESWLVRERRVDERALEGVEIGKGARRPEVEVRRPLELVAGAEVPAPERLLAGREGIKRADRRGDEISAVGRDDERLTFNLSLERDGWRAYLWDGAFPYQSLTASSDGQHLSLTAALGDGLDPLAPGVRSQVAFDLRSDLISLE